MRPLFIVVVLATVAACGSGNNVAPSATKVTLSGTVMNNSGAPMAATVHIGDSQGNATLCPFDLQGRYVCANLTPATYTVWAAAAGYEIQDKILTLTRDTVFDFMLPRAAAPSP